jgi:hypothetical protein
MRNGFMWSLTLGLLVAIFGVSVVLPIFFSGTFSGGYDFQVYYGAEIARALGLNPYSHADMATVASLTPQIQILRDVPLDTYTYLPWTLALFHPLSFFSLVQASASLALLKIGAFAGICFFWYRIFDFGRSRLFPLLLVLVPFAFGGALLVDFRGGNISVFEQLVIWAAFYAYTRGKITWCGLLICAAASVRLTPILLLGVLGAKFDRREMTSMVGFAALFILIVAVNAWIWPDLFSSFLAGVLDRTDGAMDRGVNNPSLLALIHDIANWTQETRGRSVPRIAELFSYALIALTAVSFTAAALWRIRLQSTLEAQRWRICLICLLYAVSAPRLQAYGYILLIAPALYIIINARIVNAASALGFLVVVQAAGPFTQFGKALEPIIHVQRDYYDLVVACALWAAVCGYLLRAKLVDREVRAGIGVAATRSDLLVSRL